MYAKSVGWDTWWHKDSPPRMMIRYPDPLYSPWPARWPGPAPPLFSSPDRESSHPAREQWTVSPGTSGHWARQITRTPPCNAIMSSERPDNWLICSSPWPSLGTWSQWRRARESCSLELEHTVQFSEYAYKGQVEEERMYVNLLCCFKDSTLKIGSLNCYSKIISSSVDLSTSTKLNIIYIPNKQHPTNFYIISDKEHYQYLLTDLRNNPGIPTVVPNTIKNMYSAEKWILIQIQRHIAIVLTS